MFRYGGLLVEYVRTLPWYERQEKGSYGFTSGVTMQTTKLGNSDMHITPLGFGAWAAGGRWTFGWSKQDDNDSIAAIHKALDLGINWIDTAPIYGLGHSEEVVARALDGISQRPYVFTKCSQIWNEQHELSESLKADSLRREAEARLRRLKGGVVDPYQNQWPRT